LSVMKWCTIAFCRGSIGLARSGGWVYQTSWNEPLCRPRASFTRCKSRLNPSRDFMRCIPMTQCLSVMKWCTIAFCRGSIELGVGQIQIRRMGVPKQLPAKMWRYFGRVGLCTWNTRSVNSYCICDTSELFHLYIRVSRGPFVFN